LPSQENFKSLIFTVFVQTEENESVLKDETGVPLDARNERGLEVNNNNK